MAMNEEQDNEALQELLKAPPTTPKPTMNTVQPGMDEPQGQAPPSEPAPSSPPDETPKEGPDTSKWDTDGYSKPGYVASNIGNAPAGWDQTKWANPNHQTPKYVVGRILSEAGAGGNLADPKAREAAVAKIQQAYPGTTYDGKDKVTMPDGGVVDIFVGASAGQYSPAWQPLTGPGGAPLPAEGGAAGGAAYGMPGAGGPSATDRINSLVPTDTNTYQALMQRIQGILGPQASGDREALMSILGE